MDITTKRAFRLGDLMFIPQFQLSIKTMTQCGDVKIVPCNSINWQVKKRRPMGSIYKTVGEVWADARASRKQVAARFCAK